VGCAYISRREGDRMLTGINNPDRDMVIIGNDERLTLESAIRFQTAWPIWHIENTDEFLLLRHENCTHEHSEKWYNRYLG